MCAKAGSRLVWGHVFEGYFNKAGFDSPCLCRERLRCKKKKKRPDEKKGFDSLRAV